MSYNRKTVGDNWGNSCMMNWGNCMMNWGNSMVGKWGNSSMMNGGNSSCMMNSMGNSWYYRGSIKSCMMGNRGMYCSCVMNSMGNYWGSMDSMMNTMGNTWDNWSSMKRSMVGNWMDGMMGNWVNSMMDRFRDWLAIFIKFGFGKEWIEKGIGIKGVQFWGSITVNSIPCFTSEKMLVKQCSIWTDEPCTMRTMSSVFTNTVGLTS